MNHGHPYIGSGQHMQMSTGASYVPHSQTAGMSHYQQYHPQTTNAYHPGPSSYGYQYGPTTSSYSNGQPSSVTSSLLPFSRRSLQCRELQNRCLLTKYQIVGTSAGGQHGYHAHPQYTPGGHQPVNTFDTSGQIQPASKTKPRMTATLWEDEGTLCFQVEAKGVTVARRDGKIKSLMRGSFSINTDCSGFEQTTDTSMVQNYSTFAV